MTLDPKKKKFILIGSIALGIMIVLAVILLLVKTNSNNDEDELGTAELVY